MRPAVPGRSAASELEPPIETGRPGAPSRRLAAQGRSAVSVFEEPEPAMEPAMEPERPAAPPRRSAAPERSTVPATDPGRSTRAGPEYPEAVQGRSTAEGHSGARLDRSAASPLAGASVSGRPA